MPLIVVNDLLFKWRFPRRVGGGGGRGLVLCVVQSLCLLWMVWKECNCRAFEGFERSLADLKLFLLHILHKWMAGSNQLPFTLLDFIDGCSLS